MVLCFQTWATYQLTILLYMSKLIIKTVIEKLAMNIRIRNRNRIHIVVKVYSSYRNTHLFILAICRWISEYIKYSIVFIEQ
jgi:hypothetical protein